METGYQRGRIQEESLLYEHQKHSGELPIVGVNTFLNPEEKGHEKTTLELARSNDDEKKDQIKRLRGFQKRNAKPAPDALARLRQAAISNGNIFEALMDASRVCS